MARPLVAPAFVLMGFIAGCGREAGTSEPPAAAPAAAGSAVGEDGRLSRLLVGSWESNEQGVAGIETYFPDGTSSGTMTTTLDSGEPLVVTLRSTWRVEGKTIRERVTESKPAVVPVGTAWADEIITLDGEKLVTRDEEGELETRRRVGK